MIAVAVGLASVAVAFLPWHHSGSATRNSYQLLSSADRLGLVHGNALRILSWAWILFPLIVAMAGLALALQARAPAAALAAVAGGIQVVAGAVAIRSADSGWGASAGVVVGSLLIASAAGLAITGSPSGVRR